MDRVIFHCDLNCFYASVELLSHPELREVPVAVAGDPASRHGIILAKNESAKQCGVKTAETIWQAKKKCPNLVLLPAHHKLYREYSNKVNAIYDEYTDLAESFGIDESWLDVTNTLHLFGGDAKALADAIRQRVKRELGLTLREGVYFYCYGPQYETPAEIRAARILGGDAVGMSTAPEVIVAAHCGMEVLGLTLLSNMAAGILDQPLSEQEVLDAAEAARETFSGLVRACLPKL